MELGIKPLGTENFTQTANNAHHVRASDDNVEVHPVSPWIFCIVLLSASVVCASCQSCVNLVALCRIP